MEPLKIDFSSDLDRKGPTPLYQQIAAIIEAEIRGGGLRPGDRLDPEPAISEHFNVSRVTVRLAIGELVQRGLLVRKQGKGTFVLQQAVRHDLRQSHGLLASLLTQSPNAHVELQRYELAFPPAAVRRAFGLEAGEPALALSRLYYVDGRPVGFGEDWLVAQAAQVPRATANLISTENILRQVGIAVAYSETRITSESATTAMRTLLKVTARAPLLVLKRSVYGEDGKIKEFGRLTFCTDRYEFFFSTREKELAPSPFGIRSVAEDL